MLPLTSQRSLQRWEAVVIEPYAVLQLNYIELPTDKYPKLDDICREVPSRSVNRKLVGGLLNIEDIYFKTTLFPNFVACLKDAHKSAFNIDSDVRIVRVTRDYTSKVIVHDDPGLPYFGNDFYTKFKTNLASIPVWGVDDDLVETFSTGYRMMEKPLHITKEKKLTPRTSILGRKQKLEKILTNELKVGHGRAESIKNADFEPESKTEDEQKQRSRWGVFPFNSPCDNSDRNVRRQNQRDDDTTNFYDGHFERIPELLLPVCTPETNLLGHIWPDQGSKPAEFLQYSSSTALERFSGNNALSERGCGSIESNPSTTTTHIIDRLFEKKLFFGTKFESFITEEMEGLIDYKMTSILDFDASRKKRRIDKDAMQFEKSRLATLKAEDIEEIRGVTAAANPWLQAMQTIDKEVKKRAQFEEFDVLDLESLSSSRSNWSYSGGQNVPMLFSEAFFVPRTESSEQTTSEAEAMSMVAIVDIGVSSQFSTRPLSVTGKLVNLVRQILQEPSVRLKGSVKDRLLSSAHALRCIPIPPMLPHTFVRGRGSSELGGDESMLHQEVEQWECNPSAVGRSMIAMLQNQFKLDASERKGGGTDQRERQIFSGLSPDVGRGPQGWLGRVSLLGRTSRSILKEVAEICTPLADSSATDGGLGACSGSRRRKEARRLARPTSMTEFLRYAFLSAASIESTGYSSFCTGDATVAMGAVDIARGAGEECKNQESLATGAALITNIEAVRARKYGDENRYAQLKSPVLSVVPAISESPHEAKKAGDTENRAVDKMRDDQGRADEVVTEEPELHSHVPLSHMDIQSGPDPRSSAEIDHKREVASLVPQTLDLDQMVASYLSMHRLPSARGKAIPPSVGRLRVNPIVITPSLTSDIPSSHGRRNNGMSLESWSSRFQTGQEAQESEQRKGVMDAVHSSLLVTTRDAPPSISARNRDEMTRAAPLGKQSQFFSAIYPPTALTSMVTPSKGEGEGEGEEEVQESNWTERETNVTAPASSFRFNGLCILVSESFLELSEGSWAITTLAEKYGITCIDTLLKDPVTAIVDGSTAICVVEEGIVGQINLLKEFVKQMTALVYRYSCIWIIIISRNGDEKAARRDGREGELETGMRNLYTAISRFPITVVVRSIMERDSKAPHATTNTSTDTDTGTGTVVGAQLAGMIHFICNDIANAVCIAHNILRERFVSRDFLKALLGRDSIAFAEQCDFLQLFPSLNFYTAAQIISNISLKRIAEHLPERISALKQALQFVPPIDAVCLESAFALFNVHCGLQRSVGRSAESVAAIENHREGSPRDREPAADRASVSALDSRELTRAQPVLYSDSLKDHDGGSWVTPENGGQDRRGGDNYVSGGYSRERTAGDRGIRGQRRGQAETQRQGGYGAFHHELAYGDGIGDNNSNNDDNKNNYARRYGSHENSNIEPRQYISLHDGSGDRDQNGSNSGPWRSSGGHYDERPTDRGAGRKTGYGYETWGRDVEGFIKPFCPEENEQQFKLPFGRRELQRQTAPWNENQDRRTHNDFDERQSDSGSSRQKGDSLAGIVDYDYPKRTKAGAERPRDTQNISGQQQQFQHQHHYQNRKSEENLYSDIRFTDDYDRQIVYSQHQPQYQQQFQQENRQYPLQHNASAVVGRIQDPRSFARPDRR
jgi:hypothetical protein